MNPKLALAIASLFIVSALAAITIAAPTVKAAQPMDCVTGLTTMDPSKCHDVAGVGDPLWTALTTLLVNPASPLPCVAGTTDADHDGRYDEVICSVPEDPSGTTTTSNLDIHLQVDLFRNDNDPTTADEPYDVATLASILLQKPFDIALGPTLHVALCDDPTTGLLIGGCFGTGYTAGAYRLSNHFQRQESFLDDTPSHPHKHTPEGFTLAIYSPVDPAQPHVDGNYQDGACILCVNATSARVVFGLGSQVNEGILDADANEHSIQGFYHDEVLQVRTPGVLLETPVPQFADGHGLLIHEVFVSSHADTDDDGFSDQAELDPACLSNPTNPLSTCNDIDGDGIPNDVDPDPYTPFHPVDTDGDGVQDSSDNCPLVKNADQADYDHDGIGDVCDDSDSDGLMDAQEAPINATATSLWNRADTDGDGLKDGVEATHGTNPTAIDSDADGLTDCQELAIAGVTCHGGLDPSGPNDNATVTYLSTVPALVFASDYTGSLPDANKNDTDGDGVKDGNLTLALSNGYSVSKTFDNCVSTANADQKNSDVGFAAQFPGNVTADTAGDACDKDLDGDGVSNADESASYFTDPAKADTDGDGLTDGQEIRDNTRCVSSVVAPLAGTPADRCTEFIVKGRRGASATVPVVGLPVSTPDVQPVYVFLNPLKADTCGDGTNDTAADLGKSPCTPSLPGVPNLGGLPVGDSYDYYDVNADGPKGDGLNDTDQTNASSPHHAHPRGDANDKEGDGQLDLVESGLAYYDQDPTGTTDADSHGRFAGGSGLTLVVWDTPGPTPYVQGRDATYVRYGDVSATQGLSEIVVIEVSQDVFDNTPIPFRTLCAVRDQGVPALYMSLDPYDPTAEHPCGDRVNGWDDASGLPGINTALAIADPFAFFYPEAPDTPWLTFIDANRDGFPEQLRVVTPDDPTACLTDVCHPGTPTYVDLSSVSDVGAQILGAIGGAGGGTGPCTVFGPPVPGCENACSGANPALLCLPAGCNPASPATCVDPCSTGLPLMGCTPPAPFAVDAGGPYSGETSQAIPIAANVTGASGTPSCTWTSNGTATFANASACSTTVTYGSAGSYVLHLNVTDGTHTGNDTASVTVTAPGPLASHPGGPYSGTNGTAIAIAGSGTGGSGSKSCLWTTNATSGTYHFGNASACSTTVTFDHPGLYGLSLKVTDGAAANATNSTTVSVTAPPPPAAVGPLEEAYGCPDADLFGECAALAALDGALSGLPPPPGGLKECGPDAYNQFMHLLYVCTTPAGTGFFGLGLDVNVPGVIDLWL